MARFSFTQTPLSGLMLIDRQPLQDARGIFERLFCAEEFYAIGFTEPVAQINHSQTAESGTVRGMHFQRSPFLESKIVSCVQGEVFDVAVDLRMGSPTFLQWHAEILSANNHRSLMIPKGFAHGFQALSTNCELIYLHSAPYSAEAESSVSPTEPKIAIKWPLKITSMSERDRNRPVLEDNFLGIQL